jgi:hypothetical protein
MKNAPTLRERRWPGFVQGIGVGLWSALANRESPLPAIQKARDDLASSAGTSEAAVESLTQAFQALATQSTRIIDLASGIVACIDDDGVRSVMPKVKALGSAAIDFVEARLKASQGILETSSTELKVLRHLDKVSRNQAAIALRIRVLTIMTKVELGRLSRSGTVFEHLANELSSFSLTLNEDTDELEFRTGSRRLAVEATNSILAAELPLLSENFVRIKLNLSDDLTALESGLTKLDSIPAQFQDYAQQIAAQIAGVVSAIQSYDITRQQIEHVQEALVYVAAEVRTGGGRAHAGTGVHSVAFTGITIQIHQLRQTRDTITRWTTQIKDCIGVMLKVSASDLVEISPMIYQCERDVLARLAHIELLESESRSYSEKIRRTVGEHSSLVQLIDVQVKKAEGTQLRLHRLSLNAIIEASRLGAQADAVLEIGSAITAICLEWSRITSSSCEARLEIINMAQQFDEWMKTLSDAAFESLRNAQINTREALQSLSSASGFSSGQARDIERALATMHATAAGITNSVALLDAATRTIDGILSTLESARLQLDSGQAELRGQPVSAEMKRLFSASYTTEIERQVLEAAFGGAVLQPVHESVEGNQVELF